jgi:glutathione synthase
VKIAFVLNRVETEVELATSTLLAFEAHRRGHEVYVCGVGDLTLRADNHVTGEARIPTGKPRRPGTFLAQLQARTAQRGVFSSEDLDVLWLRYNPAEAVGDDEWARHGGIHFGQLALRRGVLVLNHPFSLPLAMSKFYLQHFPEEVRPRTLISRSTEEIRRFYEENGRRIVLKPMDGYGGADVFCLDHDEANLKQMIDAVRRSGFVLAQEFLEESADGDVRMFLVNGRPLRVDGKYAAIRRIPQGGDFRSNLSAGGKVARAKVDDRMLELAEALRPKLIADGIFFAGIDIVGDKVVEVNAISAGALQASQRVEGAAFGDFVIQSIEHKVEHRRRYEGTLSNRKLAVLE